MKLMEKRSERLQLRLTPCSLHRLRVMSCSNHDSMASFLEGLINRAWHEQVSFDDVHPEPQPEED